MGLKSAWETYVTTALSTYKAEFDIGKDLDTFLKSHTGDFKKAFISYNGFYTNSVYEDGVYDLRVHEFAIYINTKDISITDIETLLTYINGHRKVTATGITLRIGEVSGQYVTSPNGLRVFQITILTHSGDALN